MAPDLDGSASEGEARDAEPSLEVDPETGETPDLSAEVEDSDPGQEAAAEDPVDEDDSHEDVSHEDRPEAPAGPPPAEVSALARFRAYTFLTLGPLVTGYVAIAGLLALVTGIASNATFTTAGVLRAALPSWLAAHQVPIEIFGLELGILPLLPTIGVAAITARTAARAAARLDLRRPGQATPVICTVAGAHSFAGVVFAGISSGAEVGADPLAALYYPALVSGLAATAGVARRCGLLAALTHRADSVAVAGLRAGALAVALLLTAGGAVLTFGLLTSIATARDLFPMGVGNAVGMLLLSIGYLPNAIVAATSFVAGPGFSLGSVTVSPLEFHGGRLPGVPLFAAMPEHHAAWWPALFAVPLAVGVVVGRRLRHVDEDPVARLRAVTVAAGVVAVCFVVLAGTAGGRLGRGNYDPVSMEAAALSIALVLWVVVPGAITAWFGGPRPATDPLPGLIDDDPEHEPDEEPDQEPAEPEEPADEDGQCADVPGPRDSVEESGEVARD